MLKRVSVGSEMAGKFKLRNDVCRWRCMKSKKTGGSKDLSVILAYPYVAHFREIEDKSERNAGIASKKLKSRKERATADLILPL
ncbi:hypothetical protein ES703_51800 [subsurface metagenome]